LRDEARQSDEAELQGGPREPVDLPEERRLKERLADTREQTGQRIVTKIGNAEGNE
jgi:hypothetical protein